MFPRQHHGGGFVTSNAAPSSRTAWVSKFRRSSCPSPTGMASVTATPDAAAAAIDDGVVGESGVELVSAGAAGDKTGGVGNGHQLSVSTPEKAGMSEELKE